LPAGREGRIGRPGFGTGDIIDFDVIIAAAAENTQTDGCRERKEAGSAEAGRHKNHNTFYDFPSYRARLLACGSKDEWIDGWLIMDPHRFV
jgi:hypothetical protein